MTILYPLSSILTYLRRQPKIARYLTIACLLFVLENLGAGFFYHDPVCFWLAGAFLLIGLMANLSGRDLKSFVFLGCMALSHLCLRTAARLNGMRSQSQFDLATISGHTSKEDPAEPPVLITDLLSILDRATGKSIELEIPGYRIKATSVTLMDKFIEKNAGREGKPLPELQPWFAHKG